MNEVVSEIELRDKVQRGDHAARIMKDTLVIEALNNMRTTVYHNIASSSHTQKEERENLYLMLRAIQGFEDQFKEAINGGKKAKSRLLTLFKGDRNGS